MPPKKRKSSGVTKSTTKKAKKTPTTTMPDRSKAANKSLLSSDPLIPLKTAGKRKSEPILIDDYADKFYSSGTGNYSASPVQQNLNKLFDSYRDRPAQSPDRILIDGAQKYLEDLSIALDEVAHLALCDLLSCPTIAEFDRESFVTGWTAASTPSLNGTSNSTAPSKPLDTIARQQAHINTLRRRLTTEPAYFKQVYRSAFKLAKPESQRSVPLESAIDFWKMCFSASSGGVEWNSKSTPWLDLWCDFYETQGKRPVNKDLWNMVGELVVKTKEPGGESLEWWTEDGAWPMAVDEFVSWVKEKRKTEGGADEMDTSS